MHSTVKIKKAQYYFISGDGGNYDDIRALHKPSQVATPRVFCLLIAQYVESKRRILSRLMFMLNGPLIFL